MVALSGCSDSRTSSVRWSQHGQRQFARWWPLSQRLAAGFPLTSRTSVVVVVLLLVLLVLLVLLAVVLLVRAGGSDSRGKRLMPRACARRGKS